MKKVAYIASECVPFIKTGGLADVVGTLPKIFDRNEYDVRVIMPNYLCIPNKYREKMQYLTHFYMDIGYKNDYVGVMYLEYEGVKVYFIDNEYYFNGFTPYGDVKWDIEKFSFFSKAALCILPAVGFQPDILHCHDWQAGLVPVYLKTLFAGNPFFSGMKSVMTIHNLQFQGKWDIDTLKADSGLPDYVFTPDKLEVRKDASMLKGGLVYADKITTVSNTYAREIQTPYYGEGLDGLLSARWQSLWGIVNGIDYDVWNPATDSQVYKNYSVDNFRELKKINKVELQKECGLPQDDKQFVIGIISRLTDQKGLDLVDRIMNDICCDVVLFQMNHTTMIATIAQRIIDGKLPNVGMNMVGIEESIAPNDTPFVAYVTKPKIISMLAMVEMNGCILYFAMKKPAILANTVVRITQATSAKIALGAAGIFEKSKICPNTPPVLGPLCMMIVAVTIPIPTIRPMERSVPVSKIKPATPSARNIRGDACCKIFRILVTVNNCVFLTIGVIIQSAMKIRMITIYRPFL